LSLKPNIFFILFDGFRADKCYGNKKTSVTPNIDSLIKNGTYFSQAVSSAPGTIPCVASIFTGLYPFECLEEDGKLFKLNSNIDTYIKNLRDSGYNTYATFQEVMHYIGMKKIFADNIEPYPLSLNMWSGIGQKIIDRFVSKTMKEPWIYYLHLYDLHMVGYTYEQRLRVGPKEISDEKYGVNHYERIISAVDVWIGKILEKIDLEKTLVVLTADHGIEHGAYTSEMWDLHNQSREKKQQSLVSNPSSSIYKLSHKIVVNFPSFLLPIRKKLAEMYTDRSDKKSREKVLAGVEENLENRKLRPYEERLMRHCGVHYAHIYEDRVRVPLIFCGHNIQSGKIISQQVRSIDIFPTITELVGLPNKEQTHGISLVPLLKGENLEEYPVFMESALNATNALSTNTIGVRTSKYKYFRDKNNPTQNIHLYDLKNDPLEENNISKEKPEMTKKMETMLIKIKDHEMFNSEKSKEIMSDEERDRAIMKLRKLGYI